MINDNITHKYSHNDNVEYNYFLDQAKKFYNQNNLSAAILFSLLANGRLDSLKNALDAAGVSDVLQAIQDKSTDDSNNLLPKIDTNSWSSTNSLLDSSDIAVITDNDHLNELIKLFDDIYLNKKYINKKAINNAIKEYVDSYGNEVYLNEQLVQDIFNNIALELGIESIPDIIELIDKASKTDENTYRNLLKKILVSLGQDTATARLVLDEERSKLNSVFDKSQYIIENANAKQELKDLVKYMRYLNLMITGASDGFNKFMNDYNISEAAVIDQNVAKDLIDQSIRLEDEINTLLLISDQSENQRLRVQKDIDINMLPKFFMSLFNGNVPADIKKNFGIDIYTLRDTAFEQSGILFNNDAFDVDINESNFNAFQAAFYNFQKLLSDEFEKLNLSQIELAAKWYDS